MTGISRVIGVVPKKQVYPSFKAQGINVYKSVPVINNQKNADYEVCPDCNSSHFLFRTISFSQNVSQNLITHKFPEKNTSSSSEKLKIESVNLEIAKELLQSNNQYKETILQNPKSVEQLLSYVSPDVDSDGNLVSGLTRTLSVEEAVEFLNLGVDYSQVNNFIILKDAHFGKYSIERYLNDSQLMEKYLLFTSNDVDEDGNLLSGLPRALSYSEASTLLARNKDYTVEQAACYIELSKKKVPYSEKFEFIDSPEKMQLYRTYTSSMLSDTEMQTLGLTRALTGKEAYDVINNRFTPEQIETFVRINDVMGYSVHSVKFVGDIDKLELLKKYQSKEVDFQGNLVSGLSRPLTFEESFIVAFQDFDNAKIEEFLRFKENLGKIINPSADFDVQTSLFVKYVQDIPFEEFYDYIEQIDLQQAIGLAPEIANYNPRQMLQFLSYHYRNGKLTSFAPDDLILSKDFTAYLTENYLSAEKMSQLLAACPNTSRKVGSMPNGWLDNIPVVKQSTVETQIYETITSFQHNGDVDGFASSMSIILGKDVIVSELGSGSFGTGYRIQVDGCKDVCLKLFFENSGMNPKYIAGKDYGRYIHGQHIEPQTGLFLNAHSDEYAHMYFGRVSPIGEKDGFLVVEFLSDSSSPLHSEVVKDSNYTIISLDSSGNHNIINGKIIDYGAVMIGHKKQ